MAIRAQRGLSNADPAAPRELPLHRPAGSAWHGAGEPAHSSLSGLAATMCVSLMGLLWLPMSKSEVSCRPSASPTFICTSCDTNRLEIRKPLDRHPDLNGTSTAML